MKDEMGSKKAAGIEDDEYAWIHCPECGVLFPPNTYWHGHHTGKFCCIAHSIAWHEKNAEQYKPEFVTTKFLVVMNDLSMKRIRLDAAAEQLGISMDVMRDQRMRYRRWKSGQYEVES